MNLPVLAKILPCPFCGQEPVYTHIQDKHTMSCEECNMQMCAASSVELVDRWERRHVATIRLGRYDVGISEDDKTSISEAMRKLGSEGACIVNNDKEDE